MIDGESVQSDGESAQGFSAQVGWESLQGRVVGCDELEEKVL